MSNTKLAKLQKMKELMEKRNVLLKEQKMLEPGYGVATLLEGELERAELILAAKDVVNRLQDQAERLAKMSVEDIMPLVDNMKGEFSADEANAFDEAANTSLKAALDGIKNAREQINANVLRMEGKLSDEDVGSLDEPTLGGAEGGDGVGSDNLEPELAGSDDDLDLGSPEAEGDIFGDGAEEEPLGRARKESVSRMGKALNESKKKSLNETEIDPYQADLFAAIEDLVEANVYPDSLEAELIANRYGLEISEITEACEATIEDAFTAEVDVARTPGSALREALDIEEGILGSIASGISSMVGGAVGGGVGAVGGPVGYIAGKELGSSAGKKLADIVGLADDETENDDDEEAAIEKEVEKDPRLADKLGNVMNKLPANAIKDVVSDSTNNQATPIVEHIIVEDVVEISEADMVGHIKGRIANVAATKSMSVKETFGHDIKLGTPRSVVKQLAEKYGQPDTWQIARTDEGSHYIVSGAIAETAMATDTQKSITSLEEEIANIRKKHGDVTEQYKLPQEFKLESLNTKLREYNTGYQHQVAKWLTFEEANSIVEMGKKWHSSKK